MLVEKNPPANAGAAEVGLIPGSGGYFGVGNGNPLQYLCLENPIDRGAWWAMEYHMDGVSQKEKNKYCILTHIYGI